MSNNIPFEEVQAIIEHGDEAGNGSVEIVNQLRDKGLNIAPPKPEKPTTGLLGRWVRHYSYGDVMCAWDGVDGADTTAIVVKNGNIIPQSHRVHIDELTFPEETTRPEDVPVGEAWLVIQGKEADHCYAIKTGEDEWQTGSPDPMAIYNIPDDDITLVSPLTPARPVSAPRTVSTEEECAALPWGSIVAKEGYCPLVKTADNAWRSHVSEMPQTDLRTSELSPTVLREGRGE